MSSRTESQEFGEDTNSALTGSYQLGAPAHKRVTPEMLEQSECCNVDLNDLVVDLNPMLTRLVGPEITILHELESDISPIWGDASLLEQVVINLTVSARAAMPGGGTLSITTEVIQDIMDAHRTPKGVRLTISDSGNGTNAEYGLQLYAPDLSTKPIGSSLMAAHNFVLMHNGVISINSEVGHGTDVSVELPFSTMPQQVSEWHLCKSDKNTQTILLAEDVHAVGSRLYNILNKAGYHVLVATDGQRAIELLTASENTVDLCLFDAAAPLVNGYQAYDLIQQRELKVPLIIMVGSSDSSLSGMSDNAQIQQVFKPFSRANILARVKTCFTTNERAIAN